MSNATNATDGPLRVAWHATLGAHLARELAASEGVEVEVVPDAESAVRVRDDVEVLVAGRADEALLDGARLRHVLVPFAGIRDELREAVRRRPHLTLHNSHFNADFVAQHGTALLLACAQRLLPFDRALRRGDWGPRGGSASIHLAGGTALLVGFGAIGRAWVPRLRGLGMEVRAVRRAADREGDPPQAGFEALHEELAEADAVLDSLPHTPATENAFDEAAFAAMKPGALFVNVGRGRTVDPWALHRALATGRLAGAGLDVWWNYPEGDDERHATRPADPPLEEHENLVMSPHRGNEVPDWQRSAVADVGRTLGALARGEVGRNRVDPELGY